MRASAPVMHCAQRVFTEWGRGCSSGDPSRDSQCCACALGGALDRPTLQGWLSGVAGRGRSARLDRESPEVGAAELGGP